MNDQTTSHKSDTEQRGFAPHQFTNNAGDGGAGDIAAEPAAASVRKQCGDVDVPCCGDQDFVREERNNGDSTR